MTRGTMWPRAILHVDLDAFFTSVHQRDAPHLVGQPVVAASRSRRAVVLTASYEARRFGIGSAMPLFQAKELCPNLVVVAPDRTAYRQASHDVHAIFRRFAAPELIESVALDEAYLDCTPRIRFKGSAAEELARRIRSEIRSEVGLAASVGVATSKLVAKVASSLAKPDGLVVVNPGTEAGFLAPLPTAAIGGVGPKTEGRLQELGIYTVGQLAAFDTYALVSRLGSSVAVLQRYAQGRDRTPVFGARLAKSFSSETTLEQDVSEPAAIERLIHSLAQQLTDRLTSEGVKARTVRVKLKFPDFTIVSRQVSRLSPTADIEQIASCADRAFRQSGVAGRPVRLVGLALGGLARPQQDLQLPLFQFD